MKHTANACAPYGGGRGVPTSYGWKDGTGGHLAANRYPNYLIYFGFVPRERFAPAEPQASYEEPKAQET